MMGHGVAATSWTVQRKRRTGAKSTNSGEHRVSQQGRHRRRRRSEAIAGFLHNVAPMALTIGCTSAKQS
jgi:hypothetical protein